MKEKDQRNRLEEIKSELKEEGAIHTHVDEHGKIYAHSHKNSKDENGEESEEKNHPSHVHSHAHTKAVVNRLSRAIGHLEAIKRMVEDGRDCSEVLIQLSAVRSAINNTSKVILEDHIAHCIVEAVESGENQVLEDLYKAIGYVIK